MLERMEDYYKWKKLEHWKNVVETGVVQWKGQGDEEISDNLLEKAIELLLLNCYPISIVCCHTNSNDKVILGTSLWKGIFAFINNERSIVWIKEKKFFNEFTSKEQYAILNADVSTIWLKVI